MGKHVCINVYILYIHVKNIGLDSSVGRAFDC